MLVAAQSRPPHSSRVTCPPPCPAPARQTSLEQIFNQFARDQEEEKGEVRGISSQSANKVHPGHVSVEVASKDKQAAEGLDTKTSGGAQVLPSGPATRNATQEAAPVITDLETQA